MKMHPRSGNASRRARVRTGAAALACGFAVLAAAPAGAATFETVYNFTVASGASPQGALAIDASGNLFGLSSRTLFKLSGSTFTALHHFGLGDGSPYGRPLLDEVHGVIYGTTLTGGSALHGTIWKFSAADGYVLLHSFAGGAEGAFPVSGLTTDGNMLFGTTSRGGGGAGCGALDTGCGTVFKFDPATLTLTTLHAFQNGSGIFPISEATLVGPRLYTTLPQDQFSTDRDQIGAGRPVRMRKNDGSIYTPIAINGPGSWFFGGVTPDGAGNVWGLARQTVPAEEYGGAIYKIDPLDHYTLVFAFPGIGLLGTQPLARLTYDASKNVFYGVTFEGTAHLGGCGTVFRFDPAALKLKTLHVFNCVEGSHPRTGLTLAPDGSLYGTTSEGGTDGYGTIFHIVP
jgi:uncharacterized repeat protein (TIGR03803 family)